MTDDSSHTPRRGVPADAGDDDFADDPTAAPSAEAHAEPATSQPLEEGGDVAVSAAPAVPHQHAAFMRPGSPAAKAAAASRALQMPGDERVVDAIQDDHPASVRPHHLADDAVSSDHGTPHDPSGPAVSQVIAPGVAVPPRPELVGADDVEDALVAGKHRRTYGLGTKVGAGVVALALAGGAFWGVRHFTRQPSVGQTVTSSPSATSTPSKTTPPAVSTASLMTAAEATSGLGGSGWSETETLETIPATAASITCMSNLQGIPNPTATRQRGLVSTAATKTAVLQRADSYADEASAKKAYAISLAALAACNDIPAFISSADAITGAGDESFSMTVAFQDQPLLYHTVILTRTGLSVTMVDGANIETKVPTQKLLQAAVPSLTRLAGSSHGTAPKNPTARVTAIPATPVLGWLSESDLPRITAGQGRWSATEVATVTSLGSGCEDMTLASVKGPTSGEQRSYLLNQDDAAPAQFGIDEVVYGFKDKAAAAAFAKKLSQNLDSCAKRNDTAKVSEAKNFTITGQDRASVTGRVWKVEQATGASSKVLYRVGVSTANTKVTYTLTKVTPSFDFPTDSWLQLNARAGQRSTITR